ncbi:MULTISPECIES: glycosyltransferase 87 family protein [Halocynthiibacter]|uniref:Glycosyltransferase 87 family protein n=1 Tax=Halocynthiibacter halioticoli TaxID=2986804 RepID=A0AAE3LSP6_9RHOB|nr:MULTISPECIES: glycosyltransferase 87 family protein [Halocynthiibacter]MCV6825794.1 glycosyltransferase 87 family protein [Halocynthiibacter halioticoli]MCW4058795.1 glycosyltransferase 87 family protein [Halocynthiibacter sp. SDUM655004]
MNETTSGGGEAHFGTPPLTWVLSFSLIVSYALLYPVTQPDHYKYLVPWLRAITGSDGHDVFATEFSNYTGGYISFLWLVSLAKPLLSELAVIKITAVIGSVLAAFGVTQCLAAAGWAGRARLNAGLAFLLLPTTMLNGIGWGQADAFFTAFILYSMAAVLRQRPLLAGLMFAIAVSFKLQAMFFAPFLLGYLLKSPGRMLISAGILFPVYLLVNAIYLAAGRDLLEVLTIYAGQAQTFTRLSMNAGNFWLMLDMLGPNELLSTQHRSFVLAGLTAALAAGVAIVFKVLKAPFTLHAMIYYASLSAILMPFLLPKMHERFFFPAEALLFVAALMYPRFLPVAVLTQLSGIAMYSVYHDTLGVRAILGWPWVAIAGIVLMAAAIYLLLRWGRVGGEENEFRR